MSSSISIALLLRKATAGLTKTATGGKLVFLNFVVGGGASACANFCNTLCMRYTEIEKGIEVYSDDKLSEPVGISKKCAESAVKQTAVSRMMMSIVAMGIPTFMLMVMDKMRLVPKSKFPKLFVEVPTVAFGLFMGLPLSVAYFPPVSTLSGPQLEPEFKKYETVYFSKGL